MVDDEEKTVDWDESVPISVRLKRSLVAVVDYIQQKDTHKNRTDIIEQAVREWCAKELEKNGKTLLSVVQELKDKETASREKSE